MELRASITIGLVVLLSFNAQALSMPASRSLGGQKSARLGLLERVSFTESWSRYPSPDSILASFRQDFPYAQVSQLNTADHCKALTVENRTLLGEADPISGLAAVDRPNSTFVSWYLNCLSKFVSANNYGLNLYIEKKLPGQSGITMASTPRPFQEMMKYFTEPLFNECLIKDESYTDKVHVGDGFEINQFFCHWGKLSSDVKVNYIKTWIRRIVGPEDVLLELGLAASEDALAKTIAAELEDYELHNDGRYDFLAGGNGLDVRTATQIIQFLIHIQDTLKF